ncbi:Flp pilus assembly complex ATPase component TadA [Microbacterium sp. KUDC0406]|uniref:GspE/PulE family protein n=1 Tax=Microbacterium sp. KUDC0406 TaxID=2909588 RepID=UPI001F1BFCB0|nr:ATPase, T2SS/T4P/T4SS family [Microbacterium sp. KUDC0406]UJP10281.1 Flp pilus assembly complex ATPase component TadA [Microbacterium sp. KUDC0406]
MRGVVQTLVLTGAVRASDIAGPMTELGDGHELVRHLISQRVITERQYADAISLQSGHPFVDLFTTPLDPQVVALVPGGLARKHRLIPVAHEGGRLVVGMADPTDIIAIDDVSTVADLRVDPVVVAEDALEYAFQRYVRSDAELSDLSASLEETAASQAARTEELTEQDSDAPIVRFVNLVITQAIDDRASDIHLEPGESHLTVRYRIDGVLHEMQRPDSNIQDGIVSRLKIMASIDIAERRKPQDGRLSVVHHGRKVDLRVATLPTVWGEKVVMRILDNSGVSLSLEDLRMSPSNLERFRTAIAHPHGMVLVTGPTGSGKSTTLYTALREVSTPRVNVITVEDPVEYRIPGINQVQVNAKAGMTFQAALRSILRSDPDVVLVGEIRDRETAVISVEAALTGHLLLSTLHTNDAPSAVTRLTEMGTEPFLVATALTAVVAQRLARKLCTACREAHHEDPAALRAIGFPLEPGEMPVLYRAKGCPTCSNTGYKGRIGLHEVMAMSDEIEHLVVTHATGTDIRRTAAEQGMTSLRQDGWTKVREGLTTIEEILRVTA